MLILNIPIVGAVPDRPLVGPSRMPDLRATVGRGRRHRLRARAPPPPAARGARLAAPAAAGTRTAGATPVARRTRARTVADRDPPRAALAGPATPACDV